MENLIQNKTVSRVSPRRGHRHASSQITSTNSTHSNSGTHVGVNTDNSSRKSLPHRFPQFIPEVETSNALRRSRIINDLLAGKSFLEKATQIKRELETQFQQNNLWRKYTCQFSIPFENCVQGKMQQIFDAKSLLVLQCIQQMLIIQNVQIDLIYFSLYELFGRTKALSRYDEIMESEKSLENFAQRSISEGLEIFKTKNN